MWGAFHHRPSTLNPYGRYRMGALLTWIQVVAFSPVSGRVVVWSGVCPSTPSTLSPTALKTITLVGAIFEFWPVVKIVFKIDDVVKVSRFFSCRHCIEYTMLTQRPRRRMVWGTTLNPDDTTGVPRP
jgi:hypothetical protein